MKDLVDTTEMYLRTIYELEEEGITPIRARIAERLEQSGPTSRDWVYRLRLSPNYADATWHIREAFPHAGHPVAYA